MSQSTGVFRAVSRPEGVTSRYSLVVVDEKGRPHLPFTRFYDLAQQGLSDGTARTYLTMLLPYFNYLATDDWRQHRSDRWDSPPEAVQESVRDYLVYQLACKVQWRDTYERVSLTARSPSTVGIYLSALKLFYRLMRRLKYYPYADPLIDTTSRLIREIEQEGSYANSTRRMSQINDVEKSLSQRTSENYFRLVEGDWIAQPIDDPELHQQLIEGFDKAKLCLRDQVVIRMAYESGARIGEILQLTVADWRTRGAMQEALACSKGSRGRRIKKIHFDSTTAKMLLQYLNTERAALDSESRRMNELDDSDPLFLSRRRKPYSYEAFKPHWYKLCDVIGIDLNIHGLRHWYVTQYMHLICATAKSAGELKQEQEGLVRYMAWRNPDTLGAYEHVFTEMRQADIQDQLHKRWYEGDLHYEQERSSLAPQSLPLPGPRSESTEAQTDTVGQQSDGWSDFLALGGMTHA